MNELFKGEETEADRCKQQQRRRRAAEFLRRVSSSRTRTSHGTDRNPRPPTATLPHSSLASAMVCAIYSFIKTSEYLNIPLHTFF